MEKQGPSLLLQLKNALPNAWSPLHTIASVLKEAGFRVFLVGGAVRNLVRGQRPSDLDLASDAKPQDVIRLFRKVIPTGMDHGTVTILMSGQSFEITTFRIDGTYTDARRPDSVSFTADLFQDLKRRDFTINAMALDLDTGELFDPHGGRADLAIRQIRTVGKARERFEEDGLRIARGIRFACQLGFEIEAETAKAMHDCVDKLRSVSIERFRDELWKILQSVRASMGVRTLYELGAFVVPLPLLAALDPVHIKKLEMLLDKASDLLPELKLALCLKGADQAKVDTQLEALKLSREQRKLILNSISAAQALETLIPDERLPASHELRRWLSKAGRQSWMHALALLSPQLSSQTLFLQSLVEAIEAVLADNPALGIGDLAINGNDLQKELALSASPQLGVLLKYLLDEVLDDPGKNRRETLLVLAREHSRS